MLYNIDFDIAALIFIVVYYAFIKLQFETNKLSNRVFCDLIIIVFISDALDILSAITLSYGVSIPLWINYIINTVYYLTVPLCGYILLKYVNVLLGDERVYKLGFHFNKTIICAFSVFIATNPIHKLLFEITPEGNLLHSIFFYSIYCLVLYYLLFAVYTVFRYKEFYSKKQAYSIMAFGIIVIFAIGIQILFFPTVLFTYFGVSIATFVVLFAFETPDYKMLVDMTEQLEQSRKELQKAIEKDNVLSKTVHELMNSASWEINFDENGNFQDSAWSDELRSLLGYEEGDETLDDNNIWQESLHPDDKDRTVKSFYDGMMGMGEYDMTYRLRCKNGEYRWFQGKGELVKDDNGNVISYQGVIQDCTADIEMQRLNQERTHALEELKASEFALQAALEEAKEASKAKSVFLSNMSHDIRTPMNAIIGFSNLAIEEGPDSPNQREYLEKIKSSGSHLIALINNILDMSKIESGKVNIEYVNGSITEVANNLKAILMANLSEKQQTFNVTINNIEHDYVRFDRLHLNQVLLNCLGNSIKFTPENGLLTLELTELPRDEKGRVVFKFVMSDTGIGMSPEFLKSVFNPFERERSSTISKIQGTGLGMSIVKSLTELMGGNISVESQINVGTTYTLILPVEEPILEKDEEEDNEVQKSVYTIKDDGSSKDEKISKLLGLHVLLVDDNSVNRMLGRKLLGRIGITVEEAENGEEACKFIEAAEPGKFNLILMDIQMPVMNGYEATDRLRSSENGYIKNIPIIAMTADAFEEDKRKCSEHGMNGHITKPILVDNLINTIYSALYMV